MTLIPGHDLPLGYWRNLSRAAIIPAPLVIAGVYMFGMIRDALAEALLKTRNRMKELVKENLLIKKTTSALSEVNLELEERVSRQQESITMLYERIRQLENVQLEEALDLLLETVHLFTKATRLSIWKHQHAPALLTLAASRGWNETDGLDTTREIENSIEGWVFRNNTMFSIRMLLQYDNLKTLDTGRNILTYPIIINRIVWGVLNIEEMPFLKYNRYTEQVLQMIINLAAPSLEKAYEYENLLASGEIDPETSLPLYGQFVSSLEKAAGSIGAHAGNLSIILLEITNYDSLSVEHGEQTIHTLFPDIANQLVTVSGNRARVFHYKQRNQVGMIIPNIDQDGASLLCLEILETINADIWTVNNTKLSLEVVIGFASISGGLTSTDELAAQAEKLLEFQKA